MKSIRLYAWIVVSAALLMLAACGPQSGKVRPSQVDLAQNAEALLASGEFAAAAEEFLRLAEGAEPIEANGYRYRAADALLSAQQFAAAAVLYRQTPAPTDLYGKLVGMRVAESTGDIQAGLDLLQSTPPPPADSPLAIRFAETAANIYDAAGLPLETLQYRLQLSDLLDPTSGAGQANMETLWEALSASSDAELASLDTSTLGEVAQGWIELTRLSRETLFDSQRFALRSNQWRLLYPGHPAESRLQSLAERNAELSKRPEQVALLLPLSGNAKAAAEAIRDGFLTAWYGDDAGTAPTVRVYDSAAARVDIVYDQAVSEGADVVIGPLRKATVETLWRRDSLPVTTVALNNPGNTAVVSSPKRYVFSLSPEQEARETARRAWFDQHARALLVAVDDAWGARVMEAFTDEWQQLGGETLETVRYAPDAADFRTPLVEALNISNSKQRAKDLRSILGGIKSSDRPRRDFDFIFLAGAAQAMRQLKPQVDFLDSPQVPTYSVSRCYPGNTDAQRDQDLNGLVFGDMPWVLAPPPQLLTAQLAARRNWPAKFQAYPRLYGLGVDAYALLPNLGRLRGQPSQRLKGATGNLSIRPDGTVQRELEWARFQQGVPTPMREERISLAD